MTMMILCVPPLMLDFGDSHATLTCHKSKTTVPKKRSDTHQKVSNQISGGVWICHFYLRRGMSSLRQMVTFRSVGVPITLRGWRFELNRFLNDYMCTLWKHTLLVLIYRDVFCLWFPRLIIANFSLISRDEATHNVTASMKRTEFPKHPRMKEGAAALFFKVGYFPLLFSFCHFKRRKENTQR